MEGERSKDPREEGPPQGAEKSAEQKQPAFRVVDRRHFANLEELPAGPAPQEKPRYPAFVEELMAKVADTQRRFEEKKKLMDEELRRSRERMEADFRRKLELERQHLLLPFLEILDNLDRALAAGRTGNNLSGFFQGIELVRAQFEAALRAQGVEAFPVLRLPYDPNTSQAVGVVPTSDPELDGMVVEEILRGFRMGERLLRPAQVRVGRLEAGAGERCREESGSPENADASVQAQHD